MNATQAHFERVARSYGKRSHSRFWGNLREKERAALLELLPSSSLGDVLELGSGSGYYSERLIKRACGSLTCVDFSETMLSQISFPCRRVRADLDELCDSKDLAAPYDLILCAGALEFVKKPEALFPEVSRLLHHGGCFLLLFPTQSVLGRLYSRYHRSHGVGARLFTPGEITHWAEKAGLKGVAAKPIPPFNWGIKLLKI